MKFNTKLETFLTITALMLLVVFIYFKTENQPKGRAEQKDNSSEKVVNETPKLDKNTQFVLFSFDGSQSNDVWEDTIKFAGDLKKAGKPIYFTYFINSVYLLTYSNSGKYISPEGLYGDSAIGFAESHASVSRRVKNINKAFKEGHEIASHTAGHHDGTYWPEEYWLKEFEQFNNLLYKVKENNPDVTLEEPLLVQPKDIQGFRAPELGHNDNMYLALAKNGFKYDSSETANMHELPVKDKLGIWHIKIPTIFIRGWQNGVLGMDYSIWASQSGAQELLKKGTPEWETAKVDIVEAYRNFLNESLAGNHSPVMVCNHFSKWNDGLYYEAMKDFANETCGKPGIKCGTYSEYIRFLEGK